MTTSRGAATFAFGIAIYGLAWYTHIGWYYLVSALLVSVLTVNLPLPWLNLRNLSVKRRAVYNDSVEVFEDGEVEIEVELYNRSFLPKFLISLNEQCPLAAPGEERQSFLFGFIGPRSRARASYSLSCYKRGMYSFPPLEVYTSAPFGLFRSRPSIAAPLEMTIYPKVLGMEAKSGPGHLEGRTYQGGPPVRSGEFRGSREYQPGDHYTNIHWKNSARLAKLMVKDYDQPPQGEVSIAFDTAVSLGNGRDTTLEYSIKIVASLAFRTFQDGRPFRILLDSREEYFTTWQDALYRLACLEPESQVRAPHFLGGGQQPGAMIVSAADSHTLGALQSNAASLRHMAIVLLEGFCDDENANASHELRLSGIEVVTCRPGELAEALASLSSKIQIAAGHRG